MTLARKHQRTVPLSQAEMSKAATVLAASHPALLPAAQLDSDERLSVAPGKAEAQKLICD